MQRNFDQQILNIKGEPLRAGTSLESVAAALKAAWPNLSPEAQKEIDAALDKAAGKPVTLGDACVSALMGAYADEHNLSLPERAKRMKLALRIIEGGVQDIEPEDRDLIKPLLVKAYNGPLVPVRCAELLEKDADTK